MIRVVAAALPLVVLAGCGSSAPSSAPATVTKTVTVEVPAPSDPSASAPSAASGPQSTFSDGTFEIGTDIQPGKYKTPGPSGGTSCYWARLKDTSGGSDSIIANGNPDGPTTVTISKSDAAFESARCTWTKVG